MNALSSDLRWGSQQVGGNISKLDEPKRKRSPRRRRVTHVYDRAAGDIARELGTQCRMLCGVWGWPGRKKVAYASTTDAYAPRRCQRCQRALAKRERERAERRARATRAILAALRELEDLKGLP